MPIGYGESFNYRSIINITSTGKPDYGSKTAPVNNRVFLIFTNKVNAVDIRPFNILALGSRSNKNSVTFVGSVESFLDGGKIFRDVDGCPIRECCK